jgi:acyl phosphate:glycerol-3-phosphate acyltransferase
MLLNIIIALLIGYCFGLIHPAYLLGRLVKGIDIRKGGSNNSGASNATIVLGWKYGVLTALIDIFKGTLAIMLGKYVLQYDALLLSLVAFAVIIGHNFPFYMNFKGGKGTASFIGIALALDMRLALAVALAIIVVTILTDYIALGTLAMYLVACILSYLYLPPPYFICILALSAIGIAKHIPNLIKIKNGKEIGLRSTFKKKK